jgi:hypothetical protein
MKEMFRSFVFGNWIAVYALARSVIEYALIDRAPSFQVEAYVTKRGKRRAKDLVDLVEAYRDPCPTLTVALESLREFGNQAMHPSKRYDVLRFPHIMRENAVKCITYARQVVAYLYARSPLLRS